MLLFSGATLPYEIMPKAMRTASDFLPLTQGIKLLKGTALGIPLQNMMVPVLIMIVLAVLCIGISIRFFRWE
jgi:ABC-2 type transport system permease protein